MQLPFKFLYLLCFRAVMKRKRPAPGWARGDLCHLFSDALGDEFHPRSLSSGSS